MNANSSNMFDLNITERTEFNFDTNKKNLNLRKKLVDTFTGDKSTRVNTNERSNIKS